MNILESPAWMNGIYCKIKDLNFSILDLGLIHSDASYDVAYSKDRKIFLLDQHIDRFFHSCKGLRLPLTLSKQETKQILIDLCSKAGTSDLLIWMGITRGIPLSGNPRDIANTKSNIFFYVKPYYDFTKEEKPVSMCLAKTLRTPDESVNQAYKNWSWIDLTTAQWEAIDRGFDSAVLLSTSGYVTEGPGFAVWGIKDSTVVIPKRNCLPSITIAALDQLCRESGTKVEHVDISVEEFKNLDFIGIASTSGGLKAVNLFEDKKFVNNKLFTKLSNLMREKLDDATWITCY